MPTEKTSSASRAQTRCKSAVTLRAIRAEARRGELPALLCLRELRPAIAHRRGWWWSTPSAT